MGAIAARELRSLFLSPLAWSLLGIVQAILAWLFLGQVEVYLRAQPRLAVTEGAPGATEFIIAPLLASATFILLLVVPLVTMRLISEERRGGTLPLLFSAPVSMAEIILGKYLAALGFLGILLLQITLMPLSLLLAGPLDPGLLASGLLGFALMLGSFAAAGLYMSTRTDQPVVAAVTTFGLLLLLWIADWLTQTGDPQHPSAVIGYLSLQNHYQRLLRGQIDSADILYYLLFIATFLMLSVRRLERERLHG